MICEPEIPHQCKQVLGVCRFVAKLKPRIGMWALNINH